METWEERWEKVREQEREGLRRYREQRDKESKQARAIAVALMTLRKRGGPLGIHASASRVVDGLLEFFTPEELAAFNDEWRKRHPQSKRAARQ